MWDFCSCVENFWSIYVFSYCTCLGVWSWFLITRSWLSSTGDDYLPWRKVKGCIWDFDIGVENLLSIHVSEVYIKLHFKYHEFMIEICELNCLWLIVNPNSKYLFIFILIHFQEHQTYNKHERYSSQGLRIT